MKLKIAQRHFVNNEETVKSFGEMTSRTIDAQQKKPQIEYAMNIGYKATSPTEVMEGLSQQLKRLAEKNIKVTLGDYGPGCAWFSRMTDVIGLRSYYSDKEVSQPPKGCVSCLVDGDQFNINDSNVLDGIDMIANKLVKEGWLLGLGSRDKVSLADTEELDNARKIEEMYHAFLMKNIKLDNPLGIDISNAPLSYKIFGDPIPGCYLINNSYEDFPEWYAALWEDSSRAVLTRQVGLGDTIGVMEASTLVNEIPSIYVKTRGNPAGAFNIETIRKKSVELGKTNVAEKYLKTVENESNEAELSKYYPKNQVNEVKGMILEGLREGIKLNYSQ
jgi:hypothetical protein